MKGQVRNGLKEIENLGNEKVKSRRANDSFPTFLTACYSNMAKVICRQAFSRLENMVSGEAGKSAKVPIPGPLAHMVAWLEDDVSAEEVSEPAGTSHRFN